jgi:hypothetical protein
VVAFESAFPLPALFDPVPAEVGVLLEELCLVARVDAREAGGRERRFGGVYGVGTGMRHQRSRRERRPRRWARRAAVTAADSWRANEVSMPSTKKVASRDVPPAEMSGSGIPVTGSNPVT